MLVLLLLSLSTTGSFVLFYDGTAPFVVLFTLVVDSPGSVISDGVMWAT